MTLQDPFATAPADDAPAATPAPVASVNNTSTGTDPKIVLTFKEGTGFDSSWIVVHANSVDDADALLDQKFADLMAKTKKVAAHFRGGEPAAGAQRSSGGGQSSNGRPAGATEAPDWMPAPPAPDWVYKSGFKNGNTWHAWAPPRKGEGEWQFHRQPK